jgi:hypothetical protein
VHLCGQAHEKAKAIAQTSAAHGTGPPHPDQQPGYRNAKAVQVWGSPSEDQSHAVSLGVFYMDNEANRRWVFKSDDPATLENINAVFVTIEPKGTSTKPTGKPFLYAYLRTAPTNHP